MAEGGKERSSKKRVRGSPEHEAATAKLAKVLGGTPSTAGASGGANRHEAAANESTAGGEAHPVQERRAEHAAHHGAADLVSWPDAACAPQYGRAGSEAAGSMRADVSGPSHAPQQIEVMVSSSFVARSKQRLGNTDVQEM